MARVERDVGEGFLFTKVVGLRDVVSGVGVGEEGRLYENVAGTCGEAGLDSYGVGWVGRVFIFATSGGAGAVVCPRLLEFRWLLKGRRF